MESQESPMLHCYVFRESWYLFNAFVRELEWLQAELWIFIISTMRFNLSVCFIQRLTSVWKVRREIAYDSSIKHRNFLIVWSECFSVLMTRVGIL